MIVAVPQSEPVKPTLNMAGNGFTITDIVCAALVPHTLLAVTVTSPEVLPNETKIEVVP